jgi:all-trans-nonaprenyl-diphosphate synthase
MTCYNLDFGRAKLHLVACGCSSSDSIDRYSVRNYAKSVSKSCNRDYGFRRMVCCRRDIARCRVSSTKTLETLLAGTFFFYG